jgi:hypothetical protein
MMHNWRIERSVHIMRVLRTGYQSKTFSHAEWLTACQLCETAYIYGVTVLEYAPGAPHEPCATCTLVGAAARPRTCPLAPTRCTVMMGSTRPRVYARLTLLKQLKDWQNEHRT